MPKTSPEVEIGKFLSSPELRYNPRNHSIPLFDVVDDPAVPDGVILVLPLLRHLGEPRPESVRESLELVEQTLEVNDCFRLERWLVKAQLICCRRALFFSTSTR